MNNFLSEKPKLCSQTKSQIYNIIKNAYADVVFFDSISSDCLRLLNDSSEFTISVMATKQHLSNYCNESFLIDHYPAEVVKQLKDQILLILKTCCVLILYFQKTPYIDSIKINSVKTLLLNYPQFEGLPEEELKYLLTFRNVLKVALIIIPATSHKQLLLKIAGRLEGSSTEYITGGGQKATVTRRVCIYEKEGNVTASKKQAKITSRKRQMESFEWHKAQWDLSGKQTCLSSRSQEGGSTDSENFQASPLPSENGDFTPINKEMMDAAIAIEALQSLARCGSI